MTGRERVLAVLNHQQPDRTPYEIGGTGCSSVHLIAYHQLRQKLGICVNEPVACACLTQLIAKFDPEVLDALQCDVEPLWFDSVDTEIWKTPFGINVIVPEQFGVEDLSDGSSVVKNANGDVQFKRAADAYYMDPVGVPLANISSPSELERFDDLFSRWDYPAVFDEPLEVYAARAKKLYQSTNRAVVANWQFHYLQAGQLLRGYEQFLIDLMIDKDIAHAVLSKLHHVYMNRLKGFLSALGESFDVVFLTDDLGTQQSCMISPEVYREMIYPYTAELVAQIKQAGKKVIMHSCGAISDFIPSLIEMGVDALNPVQVSAKGMNPTDLVRQFGKDIAFWGGGIDTQSAMKSEDLEAVRADVRLRCEQFGPDAPWVFTQVHNVQYDVPAENILAVQDEFCKCTRSHV